MHVLCLPLFCKDREWSLWAGAVWCGITVMAKMAAVEVVRGDCMGATGATHKHAESLNYHCRSNGWPHMLFRAPASQGSWPTPAPPSRSPQCGLACRPPDDVPAWRDHAGSATGRLSAVV